MVNLSFGKAQIGAAAFMGLMPIMWSTGAGADVMKRVAAPMVGGLATSFLMELLVYPAVYFLWRRRGLGAVGANLVSAAGATLVFALGARSGLPTPSSPITRHPAPSRPAPSSQHASPRPAG